MFKHEPGWRVSCKFRSKEQANEVVNFIKETCNIKDEDQLKLEETYYVSLMEPVSANGICEFCGRHWAEYHIDRKRSICPAELRGEKQCI